MTNIIEKIKSDKRYIWTPVLVLMYFGMNFSLEYAPDTYSTFFENDSWTYSIYQNGRPLQALVFYIIEKLGLSGPKCYYASWLIAIVALSASVILLSSIIDEHIGDRNISMLFSFVTLVNPMIVEYFLFVEKGMFMVLILLNVLAVYLTIKLFSGEKSFKRTVLYSLVVLACLIASSLTYQVSVEIYVVLFLPLLVIGCTDIKDFVLKNVYVAVQFGISLGLSIIVARMYALDRLGGFPGFKKGILIAAESFGEVVFRRFWHLREGRMVLFLALTFVVIALSALVKKKLSVILGYAYIVAGCTVVGFLLFFGAGSTPVCPRIVYSFGMLFGVVLIYFANLHKEVFVKKSGLLEKTALAAAAVLLVVVMVFEYAAFTRAFLGRYKTNGLDEYYARLLDHKIKEYEEQSGNVIDTVCYYSDQTRTWYDAGADESEISPRAQSCGWSRLTSINTYLDTDYVEGEPDPQYEAYFADRDWNIYDEEQIIFDGNKLHLCIY